MVVGVLTFSLAAAVVVALREQRRSRALERLLRRVWARGATDDAQQGSPVDLHEHARRRDPRRMQEHNRQRSV